MPSASFNPPPVPSFSRSIAYSICTPKPLAIAETVLDDLVPVAARYNEARVTPLSFNSQASWYAKIGDAG